MSRIGNLPVSIPKGVKVEISPANRVTVKGPLGELSQSVAQAIKVSAGENEITFGRSSEQKRHKAMHGLYRSLVANMITGVSKGYQADLELVGVGYRAAAKGQMLELTLGYSHNVAFQLPKEVKVETVTERGQNPKMILKSFDKQLLGQVVARIVSLRAPEPYKGKGIKIVGKYYRRKAGKTAAKTE